jgi:hypothetical protein
MVKKNKLIDTIRRHQVLTVIFIIISILVGYGLWYINYYHLELAETTWPKVAQLAVKRNDPSECSRIKPFIQDDSLPYTEHIFYCFVQVAGLMQREDVCMQYLRDTEQAGCLKSVKEAKENNNGWFRIFDH